MLEPAGREKRFRLYAQRVIPLLLLIVAVAFMQPVTAAAAEDEAVVIFRTSCRSCHTIGGGRLVGPDLRNVSERQSRQWLVDFIVDPTAVLNSGDPYALQLKQEAGGAVMAPIAGMTAEKARALLDLIEAESKLPKSQFAGLSIGDEPLTPDQVAMGRNIFLGVRRLEKSGPACLSCHSVTGAAFLGGGKLAPDLTRVYERMKGRKALASWLQAPATPTMASLFNGRGLSDEEVISMVAYLEAMAKNDSPPEPRTNFGFILLGIAGAAVGLVGADAVWSRRLRSVRKAMTRGER